MELVVIGAGPSYSSLPGALGASYLVRHGEHALLLDMGHGVFSSLANEIEPSSLDAIAISHLHPDHFIDLIPLRYYLRYEFDSPRRVRVLGPADLGARLDALHAEPGWTADTLDAEAVGGPGEREVGPFRLESTLVTHTAESYGYRVSVAGGIGLVYSGDCGRADDLAPLMRPGDVLLTEVSFGPGPVPPDALHLDAPSVGALAAARRPSRVFLTHLQMSHDPAATVAGVVARYSGPVDVMRPGLRITLGA